MPAVRNLFRALFRHDAMNREMNDEMRAHLDHATERLMERGLSRREAEAQARREFGNVSLLAEQGRDARGAAFVEVLRGDMRYGFRSLRASPAFTLVAILSLAIGIGANTAIFSLINAVMLKPLPVSHPEELVQVAMRDSVPTDPASLGSTYFTNPLWESLRDATRPYASYAVGDQGDFSLVSGGVVRTARGMYVNGDFFNTLGVQPLFGRLIAPSDDRPGCPATVVLGEAFWRSELGGARDAVGRTMSLEGKPFTILGVVPGRFFGIDVGTVQQVYVPLCAEALIRGPASALSRRSTWWLRVIARPRPGMSMTTLGERLRMASRPVMEAAVPANWTPKSMAEFQTRKLGLLPAFNGLSAVRSQYSAALKILMGMVALILLIACANVANLSLARGAARARELAVRIAIGASRARVIRQLLTEATLVAAAGTLIGIVIASWATRFLVGMLGTSSSQVMLDLSLDGKVLAFAAATCIATVLLFALLPALRATRVDPQLAMKAGGRGTAEGYNRFRTGKALVIAQSALAFVLVVGAGLLVTTFARLTSSRIGFEPDGVLVAHLRLHGASVPAAQRAGVYDRIERQIAAIPGVQSVGSVEITPVSGSSWNDDVVIEGDPVTEQKPVTPWFNEAGPGYFRTMRTQLIAGRDFGPEDTPTSPKVAIVNEALVKQVFKGASPIGRAYHTQFNGKNGERTTIIGVVESSRYQSVREKPQPVIYTTFRQEAQRGENAQFVIRAGAAAPAVIGAVKSITAAAGPDILLEFTRLDDQISESLQREKALALLSGFFGALALLLAMMGLYGVLAYTLARRRVEIGIRIALGAARSRVMRLVLGDVAILVGAGIVLGGAIAYAGARVLGSLLYGVEPRDPVTLAGSAVLLGALAFLSAAIPARRAASLEPVDALRED